MKYKLLKDITLDAIVKAGAQTTCSSFRNFEIRARKHGYWYTDPIDIDHAVNWAKELGELDWLINKGFIKEEEPEVFYKMGDRFEIAIPSENDGEIYLLSRVALETYVLIQIEGETPGSRWSDAVEIENLNKDKEFTKRDFGKLCGNRNANYFKKIS